MKKIFIIGNSHAAALADNWDHDGQPSGIVEILENIFCVWNIPLICHNLTVKDLNNALDVNLISKEDLVLFYAGSHDVRYNLVKYNNAAEVAKHYYNVANEYLKQVGCSFGFIDPVPVISDNTFFDESHGWWGFGTREEILNQYDIFCNTLLDMSTININLQKSILSGSLLMPNESMDGCHLNYEKNRLLLEEVKKFLYN